MKKKLLLLFILLICPLFLSACVKTDTSIAIDKKGNANVSTKLLFDRSLEGYLEKTLNPEMYKKDSQDTEMEFTKIYEDNYVGIQSSKNIKNAYKNDLSGLPDYLISKYKKYLKVNRSVFHKNIKINWTSDFSNMRGTDGRVIDRSTVEMIVPAIKITIPYKASKNNAQKVIDDSHTYEWKLSTANINEIILEYNIINFFNVIVFVFALILLISAIVLCLTKNKKEIYISLFAVSGVLLLYIIIFEVVCLTGNILENLNNEQNVKTNVENNYTKVANNNEQNNHSETVNNVSNEEQIKLQKIVNEYKQETYIETSKEYSVSVACAESYIQNWENPIKCTNSEKGQIEVVRKKQEAEIEARGYALDDNEPLYGNAGMPKSLALLGVPIMCFEKANMGDNSHCTKEQLTIIQAFFKNNPSDKIDWGKEYFEY